MCYYLYSSFNIDRISITFLIELNPAKMGNDCNLRNLVQYISYLRNLHEKYVSN